MISFDFQPSHTHDTRSFLSSSRNLAMSFSVKKGLKPSLQKLNAWSVISFQLKAAQEVLGQAQLTFPRSSLSCRFR